MNTSEINTNEAPPPPYDETVRNRKKSTATVVPQQKLYSIRDQRKESRGQKIDIKNTGNETKDSKIAIEDIKPPRDSFLFVLIAVTFLGLVHLLPYGFFGMANEYWMYKFRNTTLNTTDASQRTYLQVNFSALSSIITTTPSVMTNFILTFIAHNIKAKTRVMGTLIWHTVIFCVLVIFVNLNTDNWQEEFFIVTSATLVLVMCSISFGATGQYALILKLPPKYMKAYLLGGGIASLFSAVMRLLSVAISPSAISSANIYFGTGCFLLLGTTIMTFAAFHTSFFRHYTNKIEETKTEKIRTASDVKEVLKYIWSMILLNVFMWSIPSTSVSNLVVSEHHGEKGNAWANQYFITICSFLIPAITNTVGQAAYNKLDWNWPMPAMFLLVIFYQIVNTTTIYLSNALPRHHLPVLLKYDWEYALAMAVHGLAMGFIINMMTMKSIRMVPQDKTELTVLLLYFFNSMIQAVCSPLGMVSLRVI